MLYEYIIKQAQKKSYLLPCPKHINPARRIDMPKGQYIRNKPIKERFEANISMEPATGCWLWTGHCVNSGYAYLGVKKGYKLGHRLAWEFYIGPIPEGMFVLHHCDTRSCVNPYHLFIGTASDNMQDMLRKNRGNKACGEQNGGGRKLKELDVVAIRKDLRQGIVLAKEYGVTPTQISYIRLRKQWKRVG